MTPTRLDQRASHRRALVATLLSIAIAALVAAAPAYAGGPIAACKPGEPYRWPNGGATIPWNPDQGALVR